MVLRPGPYSPGPAARLREVRARPPGPLTNNIVLYGRNQTPTRLIQSSEPGLCLASGWQPAAARRVTGHRWQPAPGRAARAAAIIRAAALQRSVAASPATRVGARQGCYYLRRHRDRRAARRLCRATVTVRLSPRRLDHECLPACETP